MEIENNDINSDHNNEMTIDEKKMTALEHNIKTKGSTSYYYAHGRKYDETLNNSQGKTIEGPGIITGGEPVLLEKNSKDVKVIKSSKIFDKYQFCDDEEFAEVKINLVQYYKDVTVITEQSLESKIDEKSLKLIVNEPGDSEPRQLVVLKLFKKIVPNESTIKILKGKIIIRLRKDDVDSEWDKLSA